MSTAGIKVLKIDDVSQFYGKPYPFDFYPDSSRNQMTKDMERVKETGRIAEHEASAVDTEGNELWFHHTVVPVNDDEGRIDYFIVVSVDTTERKQAEEKIKKLNETLEERVLERTEELLKVNNEIKESESKFRSIMSSLYETAIVVYDRDGNIMELWGTPEMDERYGIRAADAVGKAIKDIIPPEQANKRLTQIRHIYDTGEKLLVEQLISFPNGDFWQETTLSPILDTKGNITAVVGFIHDITERKQAEKELVKSRQKSLLHVQRTPLAVIEWNINFEVTEWNPAAEKIFGYRKEETLGRHAEFIIHENAKEHVDKVWKDLLAQKGGKRSTNENITRDGNTIHCEWYNTPLVAESGEVLGVASLVQDVTEVKLAENKLHVQNEFLKLLKVAAVSANEAEDIKDAFQPILEEVCHYTGWEIGHAYAISKDDPNLLEPTTVWYIEDIKKFTDFRDVTEITTFARGIGLPGRVLASGKPHWIVDVTKDKNFLRTEISKDMSIKSGIAFPVMVGAKVVAVLEFFTTDAVKPDQQFMEIMTEAGTQLGRVVERKQAEKAEEEFKRIFDLSIDMICIADVATGYFKKINPSFGRILGYSDEELLRKPFFDFIHKDDIKPTLDVIEKKLSQGIEVFNFENRYRCKDGSYKWIMWSSRTISEQEKTYAVGRDITERKKVEEALREAEERLRMAMSAAEMGTWKWDIVTNQDTRDANFNRILGLKAAESTQPVEDFVERVHPEDRTAVDQELKRSIRERDIYLAEFRIVRPDGTERWLRDQGLPFYDEQDMISYMTGAVVDITERKQMEEALLQSEKMKAMGIMTSGVAHEFNNILAVISSNAQLLEEANRSDKELSETLRTICRMTDDGAAIVDRMYEFTDIHKDTSKYFSMDLTDLIKQVIDYTMPRWKEMAQANGIAYDIDQESVKALPPVLANPSEMREVFLNIVNNALDAMPDGGTITVKTQSVWGKKSGVRSNKEKASKLDEDFVEISFEDTGKGMSEEVKNKVFDPFYTTRSPEGTGLGMSVSYGIIKRHGGKIEIESKLGKGSKFIITLPQAAKTIKSEVLPKPASVEKPRNLNVLVVDDEKDLCESLSNFFKKDGHTVRSVSNGSEAIKLLKNNDFDLLVCDLVMPEINGREVIKALDTLNKRPKVGLITAWNHESIKDEDLNVDFVAKKPFKLSELRKDINNIFSS
jgi:PAS domain S-box-containing protein